MKVKAITKELAREFVPSKMNELTEVELNSVSGGIHEDSPVHVQGGTNGEVTYTHTFGREGAAGDISIGIEVSTGH